MTQSTSSSSTKAHVTKRRIIRMDGDIIIGALFPVHRQPPLKIAFTSQCGEFWEQYGIHRIEMFLRTLDAINNDPNILPNVTLGCDIRDSCWYSPVALERSIDFIKNSIASVESSNLTSAAANPQCHKPREKPIAGLIGPGSSTVTIQVQNLLSLFNIPQIGYSATSLDLSDKSLYKFFLRVVPSDKLQARALIDVVRHFNWTYISTVYTEGNYGFSGITEFQNMATEANICEAVSDKVGNNAEDAAYDKVIKNLKGKPNARVVVCFCEGMTIRGLLKAAKRLGAEGHFLFIGSDGWNVRKDVVEHIEPSAMGGLSIKLYSPEIEDFNRHYFSLRPKNNSRNVWFREFWQERFECYIEGPDRDLRYDTECDGEERLQDGFEQDAKLGFVVNAMYTMAHALHQMRNDLCTNTSEVGLCAEMSPVNGTIFLQYLLNVSFTSYSGDSLMFNRNGDPPGRYEIMNFQRLLTDNGTYYYDYVHVGDWDSGNLTMNRESIQWPSPSHGVTSMEVDSICSKPCENGKVKQLTQGGLHCCWVCIACKQNEIVLDESTCRACAQGWMPNEDLSGCLMIDIEHMQWGDTEAVVSIGFACIGFVATIWVSLIFVRHHNTPVVKASTRELSYIILIGIFISYLTTFPLVAKPNLVSCYMARVLPGFSFSLIYGALVTKTNRIARILAGSKKKIMTRKPRFMSASAQVVITCIIIGIECAIITVMLILEPADSMLTYPSKTRVKLVCNTTTIGIVVPLGFDCFLIVMCTLYAIKTRNLPENFNEAKFIGFSMYTTCVIWLAFVPIYFGSDNKVITMCLAITLSASVALILLFFPKIYIIVCKPERNARSAFTTSKDVRCHIGSASANQSRSLSASNDSKDR
ncbi:hypothetical protein CAPTEDRAFT_89748 [Capitella teleta]|uniref:G-protein coupled receptors family 3 profile domain-containing protein n=1 Tax=Capitella teleta TaxID=283909 RepID=R7TBE9_CAPTE|nr:hypothetical protein CAPTEDRAFT_89748 [Capitella teleta]|eukprot:ELT88339.1 hypothetical protein CAPTEDRAFT_89748 [Capitella teleta]